MKIVVHGTKGGYHIFTPERVLGLIDARPDFNKVAAIGQQAYAINVSNERVVFSKYRIVRDVIGEKRIGNIAFSIVLSNKLKLPGADVKALLDRLANEYFSRYMIDNSDNLDNVREDWTFVDALATTYESQLVPVAADDDAMQGSGEAAFVYYTSGEELQKYFDNPYLEDYAPFKQVFFVQNDLEGKAENPLNALRHNPSSNLTGQIDFENLKYTLKFKENGKDGVRIEVKVNGSRRSNKSKIRRKNELEIIYTKPYREEIRKTGKWYEISSEFVSIDDSAQTVTIMDVELSPELKTITFEIKDGKLNSVYDADLTLKGNGNESVRNITNNQAIFFGEELRDKWTVYGKKGSLSGKQEFIPEKQIANVVLILEKHHISRFQVYDDDGIVLNYKIQIQHKSTKPDDVEVEFAGNEIVKTWEITISHDGHDKATFTYCPAEDENPRPVYLRKKETSGSGQTKAKRYKVSPGEHGNLKDGYEYWSNSAEGYDVQSRIVTKRGYEFRGFELKDGTTIVATYRRKDPFYTNPKVIAGGLTLIIISLIILFYSIFSPKTIVNPNSQPLPTEGKNIIVYCNGIELKEQQLQDYQNLYCKKDSLPDYCQKIDSALMIRKAIRQGKIDVLRGWHYSSGQGSFKTAVDSIGDRFREKIGQAMKESDLSSKNLTDVANLITNLQLLLKIDINSLKSESYCDKVIQEINSWNLPDIEIVKNIKREIDDKKSELQENKNKQIANVTPPVNHGDPPPVKNDPSPVKVPNQLKKPVNGANQLEDRLWELVHSGNVTMSDYKKLLNSFPRKDLSNNDKSIVEYLGKICKNPDAFAKFKAIPEIKRKKATTLTEIEIGLQ